MRPKCKCDNIAGYWYAPVIYKIMDYQQALEAHVFCEQCVPKYEDAWAEYMYIGFHKKDWQWLNKKKFIESIEDTNAWLKLPYYDVSHVKDGVRWHYARHRYLDVMHKEIQGLIGVEIKEGGMIREIRKLNQSEVEQLQKKIVDEHYHHTYEPFSLHMYESRYKIEDKLYIFYKVLGEDHLEVYEYEEVEDTITRPTQDQLDRFKEAARK